MKKTKRSQFSAVIPVLAGIIGTLIVLVSITGCSAINQRANQETPAIVSGTKDGNLYPADYQIQFEQSWKVNQDFKGYLTLEGTALSTNVVQGPDNTFYKDRGFDGTSPMQTTMQNTVSWSTSKTWNIIKNIR